MPQNSFRNIGLRRDRNFSDLENKETGLTNLLNDFPSGTDTYIGDDLNEAIKSIRSYPVTQLEINQLAGITFRNTYFDENLSSSVTLTAVPLVTIKNQFDRVKLELGEESYFGGNVDSITAKFYNSSQISNNSKSLTSTTLFTGDPVIQKPFWLDGEFNFPNKFNSALTNQQGGIQWDGYIVPEADEDMVVRVETTCYTLIETAGSKLAHLINGASVSAMPITPNKYSVSPSDSAYIAENAIINIPGVGPYRIIGVTGNIFETDNPSDQIPPSGGTSIVYTRYQSWIDNIQGTIYAPIPDNTSYPDFPTGATNVNYNEPGVTTYVFNVTITNCLEFEPVLFNASIWLPTDHAAVTKTFKLSSTMVLATVFNSNFYNFIDTIPSTDPADFPEFRKFYETRLLQDGGKIGSSLERQSIRSNNTIDATNYIPPDYNNIINLGDVTPVYINFSAGSKIIALAGIPAQIGNVSVPYLSVGNILLSNNNLPTRIVKLLPGRGFIVEDEIVQSEGFALLKAVDHRGLVKITNSWSYVATTVTVGSTTNLIPGMMFIYNGGKTEITKINNGTTFEVGQAITNASAIDDPSYIYHDAGVLNYTTYEVVTVTDTSTLILDTVLGIQPGYYIKSIGKAGTEHLQEVATVNDATNTITTVSPTTGDILAGDKIIAERANINTAPPFIATLTGLSTNGANISLTNANGLVRALDIEVKSYISETTEFIAAQDRNYYRLIDITVNDSATQTSVPYKIIATSFSNPEPEPDP